MGLEQLLPLVLLKIDVALRDSVLTKVLYTQVGCNGRVDSLHSGQYGNLGEKRYC